MTDQQSHQVNATNVQSHEAGPAIDPHAAIDGALTSAVLQEAINRATRGIRLRAGNALDGGFIPDQLDSDQLRRAA